MNHIRQNFQVEFDYIDNMIKKYGYINAAHLLSDTVGSNMDNIYAAGVLYAIGVEENAMDQKLLLLEYKNLFNPEVYKFMLENYDTLLSIIDNSRNYGYTYSAIKRLVEGYLFKINCKPVEHIQWMWMRIAVQVSMPNIDEIKFTYDMLSKRMAIHATPTCVNSGYKSNQLESCFLIDIGDSMESITNSVKLMMMCSKTNGGIGVFMGRLRHGPVGERGITGGVESVMRVLKEAIGYANQLGSRPGSLTAWLPIWHIDAKKFIAMKRGSYDEKTGKLISNFEKQHFGFTIPDLFFERRLEGKKFSLFCPRKTQELYAKMHNIENIDDAKSLCDMKGEEFKLFYEECEKANIASETIDAKELSMMIHSMRCQSGEPYLMFHDTVNFLNNQKKLGTIVMSNLCSEITQYTYPDQYAATCDLATINVEKMFSHEKKVDYDLLGKITRQLIRNLNNVLDRTMKILKKDDITDNSRMNNRAIGVGIMGLASLFMKLGLEFQSSEANHLASVIRACIQYNAWDESANLAEKYGSYPNFEGSPISQGIFHHDMFFDQNERMKKYNNDIAKRYTFSLIQPSEFGINSTWEILKEKCKKGVRNSLLTTQPPTSTTSIIMSTSPANEAFFGMLYVDADNKGEDMNVYNCFREYMIENNIYDPVPIAKYLISNKGNIKGMHNIFDEYEKREKCKKMERLFITGFELNSKKDIIAKSQEYPYIDQASSYNQFKPAPNAKQMEQLTILAWINSFKTLYYLRRLAPSEAIKLGVKYVYKPKSYEGCSVCE